jgi:hypothetical protein
MVSEPWTLVLYLSTVISIPQKHAGIIFSNEMLIPKDE